MQPAQEKLLQLHLRDQARQKQRELDAAHEELQQAQVQALSKLRSPSTGCLSNIVLLQMDAFSLQAQIGSPGAGIGAGMQTLATVLISY